MSSHPPIHPPIHPPPHPLSFSSSSRPPQVDAAGAFRYASSPWFARALTALAASGVTGVAVDVWWGAVERAPRVYGWGGYRALAAAVAAAGLRLQVVLAFHACGGNVGDDAVIPLPAWVSAAAAKHDPDLFYCAAPRPGADCAGGGRNPEVLSLFADTAPGALAGRSPLQCYSDFMASFAAAFADELWGPAGGGGGGRGGAQPLIEEVVVGAGPCGELRYPSYPEPAGWRFPGVGEFQCYDRRALASLAAAAAAAGHPEWGTGGPADAGCYNSSPDSAPFFRGWGGGWATPYGRFFAAWYAGALLAHGERLAGAAAAAFRERPKKARQGGGGGGGLLHQPAASSSSLGLEALSLASASASAPPSPDRASLLRRDARSASLPEVLAAARAAEGRGGGGGSPGATPFLPPPPTSPPPPRPFTLALKLAGVHWWYRCPSHAAELAAGYDNAGGSGGTYRAVAALAARHGFALTLTCVEMCDGQHPPEALCGPEGLLRQVREAAAAEGVPLGGENALPIVLPGGGSSGSVDGGALARVAYNSDAWGPPLQEEGRARAALYSGVVVGGEAGGGGAGAGSPAGPSPPPAGTSLPPLRSVTFLRLTPAMLEPGVEGAWREFMAAMNGGGGKGE